MSFPDTPQYRALINESKYEYESNRLL